ncbi:MAG: FtsQ-type POTRA domain-containing protein [Coriobacteriia bacterium]|nr:FtsQ-type POTRA domain-containing protein [Coriobacteriia bacterium]
MRRSSGGGSRPDVSPRRRGRNVKRSSVREPRRQPSAKQQERDRIQAERRRTFVRRVGLGLAAVALLWVGWTMLANSGLFMIEDVVVEGAQELSVDEVIAVASIESGETLLGIDESGIVARLEGLAWIESADVVRRPPSTVLVRIVERERFIILDLGDTFWALDSSGRVLGQSMPATETPVPFVRDVPVFVPVVGEIVSADEVSNAIDVLAGITPELRGKVQTISSPSAGETSLITETAVEIMVGQAEQLSEKSTLALKIMAEQGESVVFIDVRSVERPVSRGLNE